MKRCSSFDPPVLKQQLFNIFIALPNITVQPSSTTIRKGELNVTAMFCEAVGVGPLHFQWEIYQTKINSWIEPSQRVMNITLPNLEFSSITEEDEGVYHCIITNDDGSIISDNATINIIS